MEYRTTRFSLSTATKKALVLINPSAPQGSYIPYYDAYPDNLTISLEMFQSLAMERLKILKSVEQVLARLNTSLATAASSKKDEIEKLFRKELKEKLTYLKVRFDLPFFLSLSVSSSSSFRRSPERRRSIFRTISSLTTFFVWLSVRAKKNVVGSSRKSWNCFAIVSKS